MRFRALLICGPLAALLLPACDQGQKQAPQLAQRPPAKVTTTTAIARDVPIYLDQIGRIVAVEVVAIVPQVGGKLVAAHVRDGANVKKNQLLFEIDPRPFEASLASAEAMLAQDKALLELARSELDRFEGAAAMNAVSKMQFDQKKNAVAIAEAKIGVGEAAVQTARLNLEYTRIHSPIDGRAGALLVHPGNVVRENNAPLLMIQRLDPIYAAFTVTENDLATVRKYMPKTDLDPGGLPRQGLKVEVDIPRDSVRVPSAANQTVTATRPGHDAPGPREGILSFLDNLVQSQTGTVELRATIPNADHYFWPGQFVTCRLVLTIQKGAVLIPAAAQQIGQQGPFVYVVRPDNTAELRLITPGQRQGDMIVVERGVNAGDKVIATGQMAVVPDAGVIEADDDTTTAMTGHARQAGSRPHN